MKLGILSAIYDGYTFEEMIDHASGVGYECVEVACWPQGKAERRYAGVSHIDVANLDDAKAKYILDYVSGHGMRISALGYYPNPLDADKARREAAIRHIYACIDAAAKLGVNLVNTFIGRDQNMTVDDSIELAVKTWDPILKYALRPRPVARWTEHLHLSGDLEEDVRSARLRQLRAELRPEPLHLAGHGLRQGGLGLP